jgi:hypothetical protein
VKNSFDGKDPDPNQEYVIVRDLDMGSYQLLRGTVVIDVKRHINGRLQQDGYNFTIKDTGEKRHTMYPWLLAENTPSSRAKLKQYHILWDERAHLDKIISVWCRKLDTLTLR